MVENLQFSGTKTCTERLQVNSLKKCKNYCNLFRPVTGSNFLTLKHNNNVPFNLVSRKKKLKNVNA